MSRSWSPGRHGAKPTPQLPITTVVTPCHDDGSEPLVPGGLAVVVGVDVDEAGRDERAVGVDRRVRRGAVDLADLDDAAVRRPRRRPVRGAAPVPSTTVPPRMTRS